MRNFHWLGLPCSNEPGEGEQVGPGNRMMLLVQFKDRSRCNRRAEKSCAANVRRHVAIGGESGPKPKRSGKDGFRSAIEEGTAFGEAIAEIRPEKVIGEVAVTNLLLPGDDGGIAID